MNALKLRMIGFIFCLSVSLMLAGCSSTKLFTSSRPTQIDSAELQLQAPSAGAPIAIISTSMGDIRVVLFPEQAPMAVENFTTLARQGYFNGSIFHRVERDFAIQGGDATGTGKSGASIWNNAAYPNETSALLRHYSGALATANSTDGSVSNYSQFYIVSTPADSISASSEKTLSEAGLSESAISSYRQVGGAPYLDGLDTVFGQVYSGMDVVDAINQVKTDDDKRPVEPVEILQITISTYDPAAEVTSDPASSASSAASVPASGSVSASASTAASAAA